MIDYARRATDMARTQAAMLLRTAGEAPAEPTARQAMALIHDCIEHLALPALALELALGLHTAAERWSIWAMWDDTLVLVLARVVSASPRDRARLLLMRSHTARMLGTSDTARVAAHEALALAESVDDRPLLAQAHNALGLNAFVRDELGVAAAHWKRAHVYADDRLVPLQRGHISMNCGTLAMHQGQLDAALEQFDTAAQHYRAANDTVAYGKARANWAEVLRRAGDAEGALAMLGQAEAIFQRAEARYDVGLVQNDIGCALLSCARWDEALSAFTRAVREFERIGSLQGKAWVLPNIAELYVSCQQWDAAERALHEARTLAELCERPLIVAAVDVDRGRMLAARGAASEALAVWQAALALQEAKGARMAADHTRALIRDLESSIRPA